MDNKTPVSDVVDDLLNRIAGRMQDVAREAGVSYSALYSWATGRRRPGQANLKKLAALAEEQSQELERLATTLRHYADEDGAHGDR